MFPASLRTWFFVHFIIDYIFAVPLFVAPESFLRFFGWTMVDPLASRLAAAALFGIGGASFFVRNADAVTYQHMLTMKLLWSSFAAMGILVSIIFDNTPRMAYIFMLVFIIFFFIWLYYKIRLGKITHNRS